MPGADRSHQANGSSLRRDVWVPDFGLEFHLRWFERIAIWDVDLDLKSTTIVWGAIRALNCAKQLLTAKLFHDDARFLVFLTLLQLLAYPTCRGVHSPQSPEGSSTELSAEAGPARGSNSPGAVPSLALSGTGRPRQETVEFFVAEIRRAHSSRPLVVGIVRREGSGFAVISTKKSSVGLKLNARG